ncbi:hypothetical protein H3H37_22920 [Duganella sp. LX20W]|uniref:Uncharacterized protein n=1 Tax=Rugamonas brunnea TaxID=2758569 RepID=A0A7W2EWK6_9BURK|nr:hypothetical protein [Rugamonas brunnea]MBA5639916.1 hypothetical protein [Rugamonas brunnea]
MNAGRSETAVPPATHAELSNYLRLSGSTLTTTEAVARAIQHWIEVQNETVAPLQGYQWKCLFLPDQSRVRMHVGEAWHYAEVVGDELMYHGRAVSPRQLTMLIAGDGRNAWRDLWIRRPGEKNWTAASQLRRQLEQQAHRPPTSHMDAMRAVASTMSDTLKTALTLVQHASYHAQEQVERRLPKHRRQEDFMIDDCKAD